MQDAKEIVGENVWFSSAFNNYVNNVNQLPFDHHMLAALVSPRPIYIMENPDYEWLGKISTYGKIPQGPLKYAIVRLEC